MSKENKKIEKFNNRETSKFYIFFEWLSKFIILNMYIIVFTTLGLIVFGFGPAIIAAQKVFKQWKNDEQPQLFNTYFTIYKSNFVFGGVLSGVTFLLIFLMMFNFLYFFYNIEVSYFRTIGMFGNLFFIFIIFLVFTFAPRFKEKYNMSNLRAINFAARFIWGYPKQLLIFFLVLLLLGIGFYIFPQFFMFVIFSIYTGISVHVFDSMTSKTEGFDNNVDD